MVSTEIVLEPVENAFQNLYYHHTQNPCFYMPN